MAEKESNQPSCTDNTDISYTRWVYHSLYQVILYMIYGACLAILVPHTSSLGMNSFESSFILSAWPLGCILAMAVLPWILELSYIQIFISLGGIHAISLSALCLTSNNNAFMLFGGSFALLLTGACHFMLVNRSSALVTLVLRGNASKAATTVEVCSNIGYSLGAYSGTVLYDNFGFPYTMLSYSGCTLLFHICLLAVLSTSNHKNKPNISTSDAVSSRDFIELHFRKELIAFVWLVQILFGATDSVLEGYMVQYFISKYKKPIQFGGLILGVGVIFEAIMSIIVERVVKKFPKLESKLLVGGLMANAGILFLVGPVLTRNNTCIDLSISITGIFLLGCLSGVIQMSAIIIGTSFLEIKVNADLAVSTTIDIVIIANFIGSFVGLIIGGGLLQYLNYGIVCAVWSPVYVLVGVFVAIYLSKIQY